jgi:pimeloyl-ACP methyl ester carboxylesterase
MEMRKVNDMGYLAAHWPLDPARATLVFIHGAGGSGNFWQPQIAGLSHRINTVALDLPGHGRSDGDGLESIEEYADAVVNFISTIDIPTPIPCGFSMGGGICLQILIKYPKLAKAGILVNTGATMKVGQALFERIENDYHGFVDLIGSLAAFEDTEPNVVRAFKEDFFRVQAGVTYGDFKACNNFDVSDRLASITAPVLVVTAQGDKLIAAQKGDVLGREIRLASREHIPGAGHIVSLEKPDQINRTILKFLERCCQTSVVALPGQF